MTMFARAVIVDGNSLGPLGIGSVENDGRLGQRSAPWDSEHVPGRDGEVLVASEPAVRAATLRLRFVLETVSRTQLLALIDETKWRLGVRKSHVFRFVDDETREVTGVIEGWEFRAIPPDLVQNATELLVDVKLADPREYETTDTVVGSIQTTPVALPLGADRSWPVIVVSGAGTFTLTYAHNDTTTLATLNISGAAAPVTIDMQTGSITDNAGEAAAFLVAGSDFPFAFDPQDGDFPTSAWPTLACSAGTAQATYRKAY